MSTAATEVESAADTPEARAGRAQRRKREELEQLAAEFVNSKLVVRQPPRRRVPRGGLAAGAAAVVVAVMATWLLWPAEPPAPARDSAPVAGEADLWAARLEAERERKRQQLQQSRQYSAKMAAADNALVNQMTSRSRRLAARADSAAPASGAAVAEPAPVQAAANCAIHVSELSDSGSLTYAEVARMKGARTDAATGHVFTPPVQASGGPTVVFEVMPNGCVRIARNAAR